MSDDGPRSHGAPSADGPEHDAWLREALRHAPDASASAPSALREAILTEARAAARAGAASPRAGSSPDASPSLLDRALRFWSSLARPQVAAGFASVMAATLVGMLWWDRPLDETMLPPPAAPPVAVTPAPAQEPAAATDRQPPAAIAASPTTSAAPPKLVAASPDATETAPATAERKQQQARESADPRRRPAADAKPAATGDEPKIERKDDTAEKASRPETQMLPGPGALAPMPPRVARAPAEATPFPAPPAAPAPAAAPVPAPPAPSPGRSESFALSKKAEEGAKEDALAQARTAPAGALGGPLDRTEAAATGRASSGKNALESESRQRAAVAGAIARPMAPLLAALASEDARWTRRLAGGERVAVDAAARAWLAEVQAAAARWERSAAAPAERDAATPFPAATLRLDRDDRAGAVVQLEDGGVRFESTASGGAWFAPLPPDVVARLRSSVPR